MAKGLIGGLVVVGVAAAGIVYWQTSGDDSAQQSDDSPTFVISPVERRTLVDEVTVRGQVRRDELQRITSPIEGQVSSLLVEAGDTINAGDTILALSGRAAVAVQGEFSFFRQLDVGSEGPDVLQLETILSADGYSVGDVDDLFTEDTRAGLSAWQLDRGYGGANPEATESISVGLQANGAGYTVGAKNAIGIVIEPRVAEPDELVEPDDKADVETDVDGSLLETGPVPARSPFSLVAPVLSSRTAAPPTTSATVPLVEVSVGPSSVAEGASATFTFTSSIPMPADTTVDYVVGGSATAGDDYNDNLTGSFVFAAGTTSFSINVVTLVDEIIESDEELTVTVGNGINVNDNELYRPGALKEAQLTITNPVGEVPLAFVRNEQTAISEGSTAQFVFETTIERNEPTTLIFSVSGSAKEGSDYAQVDREIEIAAGQTQATFSIGTIADNRVEHDEYIVVALKSSPHYNVFGDAADVIVESSDQPELTLVGGGTVGEGSSTTFTIEADQAPIEDTSVNYSMSGSATPGVDYETLTGTVLMLAGERAVEVTIQTIDDDVIFRPGDMIVADWPARIGTVNVDEGEFILLGNEVLTLTEPDFTITLQLSPTDRSNLEVGLETSVELQASAQEAVPGVIVELDDTATVDQAGIESYEGVIETSELLEAVDGASVNVDVVLERRENVITVPVASVLQDGQGDDVVRIVLEDGTTRQVAVEIGLSEGAFVEVRSGLEGDELVLIET